MARLAREALQAHVCYVTKLTADCINANIFITPPAVGEAES